MSEGNNLPRVTIDTNNVISGTISPGNYSSQLLASWSEGEFQWIQTHQTFRELQEVIHREKFRVKYGLQEKEIEGLLNAVAGGARFVTPVSMLELPVRSRDKEDDKILACAFGGECDFLITDDPDLLTLSGQKELGRLQITTANQFLKIKGMLP